MALYYPVFYLMILIPLLSNARVSITEAVSAQSHLTVETLNVCTTLACNESATRLLNYIDTSVNPCDNFYKFSCGGFINTTEIPDNDLEVSTFYMLEDEIQKQLRSIIEEPSPPNEPRYVKITKNYYKSCMNKTIVKERGLELLKEKLKEFGGWPVVEGQQWNKTNFKWFNVVRKLHKAGYVMDYFLDFKIMPDLKNRSKKVLYLSAPSCEVEADIYRYKKTEDEKMYLNRMVDIAVKLGAPKDYAIAELRKSLMFEILLARLLYQYPESNDQTLLYHPMTINELSRQYPSIPWKKYINNILNPYATIDDDEIIIIDSPIMISEFMDLMNIVQKRVQANYVMWRVVQDTILYLNEKVESKSSKYLNKRNLRWKKCIKEVTDLISGHAMYVKKYFDKNIKNYIMEIEADIMSQLKQNLYTIVWMDNETRKNALDKAAAISSYIGYPDEFLNDTILEKLYENLNFTDNNYLENKLAFTRYQLNRTYSKYREMYKKNQWENNGLPIKVNAGFDPISLTIEIPAGILQGMFFNKDLPRYMNYGTIGSFIGHEITHAFDNLGRQFDNNGNYRNWWSTLTNEKYRQQTECIINQYNNYTIEELGKQLDGFSTQNENIADNGGFKLAYSAYKNWMKKHEKEPSLPGLSYNPQQMFWISAASSFCSKSRLESLKIDLMHGVHSPYEFRILGSFQNLPEFAADFNCPIGSKMNPTDKCRFW